MLYCSAKLYRELAIPDASNPKKKDRKPLPLGNWHIDLFWCERRKCILFTSSETFLSFVVLDVFRSELRPLSSFFTTHLEIFLRSQGIPGYIRTELVEGYRNCAVDVSTDLAIEETMQDFIQHSRTLIGQHSGSIRTVDAIEIGRQLCDLPIEGLESLYPWRAARVALGLESSESAAQPVLYGSPLARRIGSPTLTVLNGGIKEVI